MCLGFDPNGSEYLLSHSVDSYRFEGGEKKKKRVQWPWQDPSQFIKLQSFEIVEYVPMLFSEMMPFSDSVDNSQTKQNTKSPGPSLLCVSEDF